MNLANRDENSLYKNDTIPVVITQMARDVAANLAHQYTDMNVAEQVYRDTLAIYVVHNYLKLLGIESILNLYERSHPIMQWVSDSAALQIPGLGVIECLAIGCSEQSRDILPEAQVDRVGYIAVRFDDDQTAELLGFSETIDHDTISVSQLTPISQFHHLFKDIQITTNLRQWLEGIYQQDWKTLEDVFTTKQLALIEPVTDGEGVQKTCRFYLGEAPNQSEIALCVLAEPEDEDLAVRIQVHPIALEQPTPQKVRFVYASTEVLSPNLELSLYSEDGTLIKQVISRTDPLDNYIQLPIIHSAAGEKFSITVTLQEYSIQQYFRT